MCAGSTSFMVYSCVQEVHPSWCIYVCRKYILCSMCRFATSCSFAYAAHMMGFHSGQVSALSQSVPWERPMAAPLYCLCGFSSKWGNRIGQFPPFSFCLGGPKLAREHRCGRLCLMETASVASSPYLVHIIVYLAGLGTLLFSVMGDLVQ